MANFGDILSGLTIGAGQSVRRNAGDSAFEAYTPSTGLTIGSTAISSGTDNRLLYQSSGVVQQSGNLTFDGTNLVLGNSGKRLEIGLDSSYNAIFGHAYAAGDNVLQYQLKYYSTGGYSTRGLKLHDTGNGFTTILNQIASGSLYITDGAGTAGALVLGTRTNPADASTFIAQYGRWIINSGAFVVNNATWSGNAQIESYSTSRPQYRAFYDGSNYASISVGSNGATTLDAVGSGAKWILADDVELSDGKNIVCGASTGTKIGTSTSQKIGFYNATPVTQRADAGTMTVPSIAGSDTVDIGAVTDALTDLNAIVANIRTALRDIGLMA